MRALILPILSMLSSGCDGAVSVRGRVVLKETKGVEAQRPLPPGTLIHIFWTLDRPNGAHPGGCVRCEADGGFYYTNIVGSPPKKLLLFVEGPSVKGTPAFAKNFEEHAVIEVEVQ